MSEILDWVTKGSKVVDYGPNGYDFTTVKQVSATLVTLENGSRYRTKDGRKVGETYSGAFHRSSLIPVGQAVRRLAIGAVREAAMEVHRASNQVTENAVDANTALDRMQAAIDTARQKLAAVAKQS